MSAKESINLALSRVTGYHLARGRPGTLPPAAQARIAALVKELKATKRRVQVLEADTGHGDTGRPRLQKVWPLTDSQEDE